MTLHYLDKQRAGANIAHVLLARGWELRGYHTDRSDSSSDYYSPASWGDGIATHLDYPGVVVGFDVGEKRAETRSGQDETTTEYERTEDCVACAGSGHDLAAPARMYSVLTAAGVQQKTEPAPCANCYGRGHMVKAVQTVLFTWPVFHGTPRGKAWHVEYGGQIIASGVGFAQAADYKTGPSAATGIADQITGIAQRCIGQPPTRDPAAAPAANDAPAPTIASHNGLTITCTYTIKNGSVWTWPTIAPRLARDRYDVVKAQFHMQWSRMRHTVYITRQVDAADILAVVEPASVAMPEPEPAPAQDAAPTPAAPPESTPEPEPPADVLPEPELAAAAQTLFVAGNTRVVDAAPEPATPEPEPTPTATPEPEPTPEPQPESPEIPPQLTFTVDADLFRTIDAAYSGSSMADNARIKTFAYAGRTWSTSGGISGDGTTPRAWAHAVVPRPAWSGDVIMPQRHGGSFRAGTVAKAGRMGEMVVTAQQAVFTPLPPTLAAPPALRPGQRWTVDAAFQSFGDDSAEAFRALDLARPRATMALDTSPITVGDATVTGERCNCKKKRGVATCRHILAIRLIRLYQQYASMEATHA